MGLLLGGVGGYLGGSSGDSGASAAGPAATATVTETAEAEPAANAGPAGGGDPDATIGEGTHLVGIDIEPGTYATDGTESCYWERMSGTSGTFDDIISNNFGGGRQVVTIEESDVAFESTRCGTWEKVS